MKIVKYVFSRDYIYLEWYDTYTGYCFAFISHPMMFLSANVVFEKRIIMEPHYIRFT